MKTLRTIFGSSKLGIAVATVVFTILNEVVKFPISEAAVHDIIITLWGWIAAQTSVDIAQSFKGSKTP